MSLHCHCTALRLLLLLLQNFSGISGNSEQKKYFTDHWAAHTIQLFVAIKGNFCNLLFFWISRSDTEFPRDYLINVATCLFACHEMFICICTSWHYDIKTNSPCFNILHWTSFWFLQVNQQKRVWMVSTNNM